MADLDKRSFVLGMITAFCECIASGCKRMALSPPLSAKDYDIISDEAYEIIEKHGLLYYHEMNMDQPEELRFNWIVIARRQPTLDEYLSLRMQGFSPVQSLIPFSELLSYNENESIHTGYDAFLTFFPR
jgi:hypothetical protein